MYKHLTFIFIIVFLLSCKDKKSNQQIAELKNSDKITSSSSVKSNNKNAEIVFCLDATGSMSGLISTAKEKIWDIVSELAQNNDIDTLKMGMVFYRDIGDAFVTKQVPLTTDLDSVYSDLLEIRADGGGDTPESVNQALHESINTFSWSENNKTYKTIFVVGDCPPHMDYDNDIPYNISCKIAAQKGIHINTIKLGNSCIDAIMHFKKMSECTNGEFLQLDQNATDYSIATPYDDEINKVSKDIDQSRLYYGNEEEQSFNNLKKEKSIEVYERSSISANSSRASYKLSKSGKKTSMGTKEMINDYSSGLVNIDKIKDAELPEILKGKTLKEKQQVLEKLKKQRKASTIKLKSLNKKRKEFIQLKEAEKSVDAAPSFSKEVLKVMEKQSSKMK